LGGAGFASQRTTGDDVSWDLSGYDGIQLKIDTTKADGVYFLVVFASNILTRSLDKRYTFTFKDELLPRNHLDGREQSTISWEYDFSIDAKDHASNHNLLLFIPWDSLKPMYRGKEKTDAPSLNLKKIKQFSIMMRRYITLPSRLLVPKYLI
jgi:hypothetical protein